MANRYANLVGSNKIKDEWQKINEGFDKVQQEMDEKPDASIAQVNDIQLGADDTLTLEGGTGITVTTVPGEKKVRFVATGESTPGPHAIEHITGGSDVIPNATTSASGLMSAADKLALDAHLAALVSDPGGVHGFLVETGNFTPYVFGSTTAGTIPYSLISGRYMKIQNRVYVEGTVRAGGPAIVQPTGNLLIGGLPYVIRTEAGNPRSPAFAISALVRIKLPANGYMVLAHGEPGQSAISLRAVVDNNDVAFVSADDQTFSATWQIRLSGWYETN